MNKQQAQNLIQESFENPFDKGRFTGFIKNLLNQIEDAPFTYQGNYIPDAYKPYISSLERIGKYTDGEHKIDILCVQLKKETSLERARTMQRNFIAWYLNGSRGGDMKDAALVAFVSPDEADWRFSLVKMDYRFEESETGRVKVKEEFTPARRWSFLVGSNEASHTAQSRLVPILAEDERNPTLKQLEDAFDIETVSKEFFLKYRDLFIRTKEALDEIVAQASSLRNEFEAKGVDTVNFAKKLLGQIVFLYFLQKKGWFGVERDAEWGTGSKHFLRQLFAGKHGEYKNFFNDILEPLFYEALRIDRRHDDDYYSRFNCKIPFLNGGLFDPIGNYDWVHTDILLPNELFSNIVKTKEGDTGNGILDILDRYNFTVKEDEPLEKEVAIDPELLGKAYEKFNAIRPDNFEEYKAALKNGKKGAENKFTKKFGVYYTPREIVHYMCQQSLINYLYSVTQASQPETEPLLTNHRQDACATISKEDIETLIKYGEQVGEHEAAVRTKGRETRDYSYKLPESIRQNAEMIDRALANITVCDPAIGSGAFPVGMMHEIVKTRNVLTHVTQASKPENPHRQDACDTYNFKRECIEKSLYGVDIDPGAVEIAKLRLWLSLVVDEEDIRRIKPLPNLDYKIVCGNSLLGLEKDLFNNQLFTELERLKPLYFDETNPTKKQEYKQQIDGLINEITDGHKEFDFEVYFSEVFHHKGGFDVVIANPPYVGQKGNKELFDLMKSDTNFEKKMDYWHFFLHKAHHLNRNNGITTFITPNYWITARGARKLRKRIVNDFTFVEWINFNDNNIFEAGVHVNVFVLQKSLTKNHYLKCVVFNKKYDDNFIHNKDKELNFTVNQESIHSQWTGFVHFLPQKTINIIEKLTSGSEKLCDTSTTGIKKEGITAGKHITDGICNLNQGIVTGKDRYIDKANNINEGVFIVNAEEANNFAQKDKERLKAFYKNSDIAKYFVNNSSRYYLIYVNDITSELELKEYSTLYNHLLRYKDVLLKRSINGVLQSAYKNGKWWALTTDRPNIDFHGEKILCPQRSSRNTFGYSDKVWYAASDVFYISLNKKNYSLKYILSIINSKLIYYWLFYMGKRKGQILELTLEPLQFIPIKQIFPIEQNPFIEIVDRILAITKDDDYLQNPQKQAKVKALEREIDQMVYQLYGLTEEEIRIIEGE